MNQSFFTTRGSGKNIDYPTTMRASHQQNTLLIYLINDKSSQSFKDNSTWSREHVSENKLQSHPYLIQGSPISSIFATVNILLRDNS